MTQTDIGDKRGSGRTSEQPLDLRPAEHLLGDHPLDLLDLTVQERDCRNARLPTVLTGEVVGVRRGWAPVVDATWTSKGDSWATPASDRPLQRRKPAIDDLTTE